jgi:hypothetical protein
VTAACAPAGARSASETARSVEVADQVAVDQLGHAVAAVGAAEGGARDAAARDEEAKNDLEHPAPAGHALRPYRRRRTGRRYPRLPTTAAVRRHESGGAGTTA